jgi:hAT family C-terminal dimerisation region
MAMDYLPIQAMSVSCECVFSSAKETNTVKRNRISPVLMEALQLLKFLLKKQCLNFMEEWSTLQAVMEGGLRDLDLGSLVTGDQEISETNLDNMLKQLSTYNIE